MSTQNIKPEKITKPMQLLAAWLLGLILINTTFLTAASQIVKPVWASGCLVIAAIINVPLFLMSIFLLQTKFRPEMQEDEYYSKHLERKYNDKPNKAEEENETEIVAELITKELGGSSSRNKKEKVENILREREKQKVENLVKNSRSLSQLYLYENQWNKFVRAWNDHPSFHRDITTLYDFGAVSGDLVDPTSLRLTELGKEIAEKLNIDKKLWNQKNDRVID